MYVMAIPRNRCIIFVFDAWYLTLHRSLITQYLLQNMSYGLELLRIKCMETR